VHAIAHDSLREESPLIASHRALARWRVLHPALDGWMITTSWGRVGR